METLDINFTVVGEGYVEATMPVNAKVHQPQGLLHGGASVALAESVGSFGSAYLLRKTGQSAVGVEINANHIRSVRAGLVTAKAQILHQGKSLHVWEIKITDEADKLVSACRLTMMVISKP